MRPISIDIYAKGYKGCVRGKNVLEPAENFIRSVKLEKIGPKSGKSTALDFGSGDGRHTDYMLKLGYRVTATDVSMEAVRATKYRVKSSRKADIIYMEPDAAIPSPDDTFDLIVSWETMHWLGSKEIFLYYIEEFLRTIRDNGYLVITMPTETHYLKSISEEVGESRYLCDASERKGAILYSPNLYTLKKILRDRFGFKIVRILRYDHGRADDRNLKNIGLNNLFSMYALTLKASK